MNSLVDRLKHHLRHKRRVRLQGLVQKHPHVGKLFRKVGLRPHRLRHHATKVLAGATLASTLLTQPAALTALPGKTLVDQNLQVLLPNLVISREAELKIQLISTLKLILPAERGQLNPWEVGRISQDLKYLFGLTATSELDGHHLNHQYGWMGIEQHLLRYPGDSLSQHDELQAAGIAPKLGAWGYFVPSMAQMTETDKLREKYYVAVQTFYLPEWNDDHQELKDWYKYRKVVVVNPETGQAVVAVIADAGPALATGKQFGGSPEVMKELQLHAGPRKGKVVLLFVGDPENKVPLGPLKYNV